MLMVCVSHFFLSNALYEGKRCSQEMLAENCARAAYATITLSSGADAASFLESMTQQADDHVGVCCQVPDEAVADDSTDTTMFGTISLLSVRYLSLEKGSWQIRLRWRREPRKNSLII